MKGNPPSRRLAPPRIRLVVASPAGFVRIKLILGCCVSASLLLLLAARSSSCLPWPPSPTPSPPRQGSTILINTWKRNDLLKKSIGHYASCSCVDSIHIVWSEPTPPSIPLQRYLHKIAKLNSGGHRNIELKFDINKEDSLNNRFKVIKDLKTDAVFSVDDDVIFPCPTLDFAYRVWQSAPDTMVGFVPRMHWLDKSKSSKESYSYGGWWSVWWMGSYSMVLSKAAFFHKKYLELYTNHMPAAIREYITKNRNCEDIAMSFLVANATGTPPIWVKGKIFEIGSTGISSLGGHNERRTDCVNDFVDIYGYMPLVSTYVKAVDSRRLWLW